MHGPELELVARRFAVLADPLRLKLVHALFDGEKSVTELVAATGGSQTNVSRDLHLLTDAHVVARRKDGLRVYYSLVDPTIFALCQLVCAGLETALAGQVAAFTPPVTSPASAPGGLAPGAVSAPPRKGPAQ